MNELLRKVAQSECTILITGNTGTGKTHLAKEIHDASKRKDKRFLAINLATLSETLLESELFGHEKGAFTNAIQKRVSKLEIANGGTVLLDEIGELPLKSQAKLLDLLNSKTITPVGSNKDVSLDIRFVLATNRNLAQMVQTKEFRQDLYFRVNTYEIALPDLSESPEQIKNLASLFAQNCASEMGINSPQIHPFYIESLLKYPWPGNIRELKNCIGFSLAVHTGSILLPEAIPPYIKRVLGNSQTPLCNEPSSGESTENVQLLEFDQAKSHFEVNYLHSALRKYDGKINLTARETGISKVTLIEKIRKYRIDVTDIKFQKQLYQRQLEATHRS